MKALIDADKMKRFESKYLPDPNSGCWLWTAGIDSSGYGTFLYNGRTLGAHKVAYLLYKGEIPTGLLVLHSCDVRCCVNPSHLFLGTLYDNMQDRNSKGRQARLRGSNNGNSKLTAEQVHIIYTSYNGKDINITTLGKEFNVDPSTIHLILKGRNWSHLTKHILRGDMKEGIGL